MGHTIDEPEFEYVKNSLLEIDEKNRQFAIDLVDYVNDTSWTEDDEFFYDMLEFLRFTKETKLAETDINGMIYLNPPQGKTIKNWDFYYCHECMHQLWDTFGVADRIKSKGIKYDHELLNIASDCVINDYLRTNRGKDGTNDIIYPEDIEKAYGVVYDRRKDTQFTLYLKILATGKGAGAMFKQPWDGKTLKPRKITRVPPPGSNGHDGPDTDWEYSEDFVKGWTDAIKDVLNKKVDPLKFKPLHNVIESTVTVSCGGTYEEGYNAAIEIIKQGLEKGLIVQGPGGDPGSDTTNLPRIPWDIPQDPNNKNGKGKGGSDKPVEQEVEEAAEAAAQADAATRSMPNKMGDPNSQGLADEAKKAAKRAKDAADKASKALARGDEKEARKQAGIAKSEAADAIGKSLEAQGLKPEKGKGGKGRSKNGEWSETFQREQTDMDKIKRAHDDIIKKVTNKITGDLGGFLDKCRDSQDLKGLETGANKGMNGWGKRALKSVNSYIEDTWGNPRWEPTYKKFNKRQGIPKEGDLLMKGKRKIQDKFNLLMNFFLDRSGSMDQGQPKRIENACDAMYSVARGLKKNWTNTETIENVDFGFYTWGTNAIKQIKMGQVPNADDGTDDIDVTVNKIVNGGYMANVNFILTDGDTDVNEPQMEELLSSSPDMWVIVCISGKDASTHQSLMSKYKNYIWIQCSSSFE